LEREIPTSPLWRMQRPICFSQLDHTIDHDDADFWKDTLFKKVKRYLCFTRDDRPAHNQVMTVNSKYKLSLRKVAFLHARETSVSFILGFGTTFGVLLVVCDAHFRLPVLGQGAAFATVPFTNREPFPSLTHPLFNSSWGASARILICYFCTAPTEILLKIVFFLTNVVVDFEYSLLFCAIKRPTIFGCDFRQKFFCTKHVFFVVDRFDRRRMCGKTGVEYTQEVIPIRGVGKIFSIFPGGHQGIFPEGDKSSEICFFPLKTKKTTFFCWEF